MGILVAKVSFLTTRAVLAAALTGHPNLSGKPGEKVKISCQCSGWKDGVGGGEG